MKRLEDGYVVAPLSKVAGAGKACRTGSDHGYFDAVGGSAVGGSVSESLVGNEPLQLADGYGFALYTKNAAALALSLLRTNASAHGGQRAVFGNDGRGTFDITLAHLGDEFGNLDVYRAGGNAARILAMQAA